MPGPPQEPWGPAEAAERRRQQRLEPLGEEEDGFEPGFRPKVPEDMDGERDGFDESYNPELPPKDMDGDQDARIGGAEAPPEQPLDEGYGSGAEDERWARGAQGGNDGAPREERPDEERGGGRADERELVRKVKYMQRKGRAAKEAWWSYADSHGSGVRDPARHTDEFLLDFIVRYESGETFKLSRSLVNDVKSMQRDPRARQAWETFTRTHGCGLRDPARHGEEFLRAFLKRYDEGFHFDREPDWVFEVQQLQRNNKRGRDAWRAFTFKQGQGIRDPARHDRGFLRGFITQYYSGVPFEATSEGEDRSDPEEDTGRVMNYSVRLTNVPREYSRETFMELHESLGLDTTAFESMKVVEDMGDAPGLCVVMLRYADGPNAKRAAEMLQGQPVADAKGNVVKLSATLKRKAEESPAVWPQVYISDLPIEWEESELRGLHEERGLVGEEAAPVSMKFLPSKDPKSETRCCIARYRSEANAQDAVDKLRGHVVFTRSGVEKHLGANTAKPAKWMLQKGMANATPFGAGADTASAAGMRPGDWICERCGDHVFGKHDACRQCGTARPTSGTSEQRLAANVPLFGTMGRWDARSGEGIILPEGGGPEVAVSREVVEGSEGLRDGTRVCFEVDWPSRPGSYRATICAPAPEPPRRAPGTKGALSEEAQAFSSRWGLEEPDLAWLASFPKDVQELVMERFNPEEEQEGSSGQHDTVGSKLRAFTRSVMSNVAITGLPAGPPKPMAPVAKAKALPSRAPPSAVQAEAPAEHAGQADAGQEAEAAPPEKADSSEQEVLFSYFCDVWKLDQATIAWMKGLDREVRAAVIDEFDGSTLEEIGDREPVKIKLSDNVFVSGLPPEGIAPNTLKALFDRCGNVVQCRLLAPGTNALVRMASEQEANIAVEDFNFRVPVGMSVALTVRFANKREEVSPQSLDGATLMGIVKVWYRERGFGFLAINGCGPDVFVYRDALVDGRDLDNGSTVVFKAAWNAAKVQLLTEKCICTRKGVMEVLNATAGTPRAVREYARAVMKRLDRGPHDILPREEGEAILAAQEPPVVQPVVVEPVVVEPSPLPFSADQPPPPSLPPPTSVPPVAKAPAVIRPPKPVGRQGMVIPPPNRAAPAASEPVVVVPPGPSAKPAES